MFIAYFERTISRLLLTVIVAVLPFLGGCSEDDNPITDDHDHEEEIFHADADGFVLMVDGEEVYRQFQGSHEGGITVTAGEEIHFDVSFLDDHEHEFNPIEEQHEAHDHDEDNDDDHQEEEEFALNLSGYDDTIIAIHFDEHEDEHGHSDDEDEHDHEDDHEDEELSFGVEGLKAGKTEIKLQLMHGDHPDYTAALLIPVTVE